MEFAINKNFRDVQTGKKLDKIVLKHLIPEHTLLQTSKI